MSDKTPTTRFAHWNKWPFINVRSNQLQSPFFRLSREIRDKIYEYYVVAENGYFYNPETRKMMDGHPSSTSPKPQVININLIRTCKIAAAEMKGLAFERNVVIFHAMCSVDDGHGYMNLNSRAGRFKTPVAIQYLETMNPRVRMSLRKIVIREDFKSVSNPELHAQGLIPFCRENMNLRITRHISLFKSMLPVHSGGQDDRRSEYYDCDVIQGAECLEAMKHWIQAVSSVHTLGMPKESFSLFFDNSVAEGDWV
ncbi:uncharacterized protein J4E88_000736 [Alternaria novae-zelandiae]|uniref:uncharacterized protein n=1 Tax=Alternaria novae-zelandiae TaxID=430562 RepID=UPI0020C3DC09|nr:uncharacterized protein J4E88_000736 [Alternaria novae-zelandiae]KAI4696559.1 hypothetical protein J4E88_000736 [Alternaria novae-zelandiae]